MSDDAEPDVLRLAVGAAIRRARLAAGMSMHALALGCGLSQPFLSAVERGRSTPSIATLYRLAEALGTTPARLLPVHAAGDVTIVSPGDGRLVPSSDRPNSAVGRVVFSDPERGLEVYEYCIAVDDDLDVWFEHPGEAVLHLIKGNLRVDFEARPSEHLGPGDCMVHPGKIAHRWAIEGDDPVRLFLVVVRAS